MIYFTFIETEKFVRQTTKLLGEESINELQLYLCEFPEDGSIIKGANGIFGWRK